MCLCVCVSSMGYVGPASVFVFFVVSTVVNKFLMSPVVALVFLQEQLEGDFRYHRRVFPVCARVCVC